MVLHSYTVWRDLPNQPISIVAMIVASDEVQAASQELKCLSDAMYCTVCTCMQTQHKVEMDKRDGMFGPPAVMVVPPFQNMSRIDQHVPPPVGYPTAQLGAYAYPPAPSYPPRGYSR